ncbi:hypothetical protein GQF03_07825 [Sneathiella chungangensis]|uniref:Lipoprotein n=1 Tax=Sneathiella chungangensis TaxID=1418234 RepID=A0A845MGS5_9PROT|nr:hypothetical protein [Sneathiella chungangensis]MZR22234.1 hypothetical protein [Sneathiella chungangensis]
MKKTLVFLLLVIGFSLSACGPLPPMKTVATANPEAGISKEFNEDPELVIAAAQASIQGLDLSITHSAREDIGYMILFTKSMSAFSWGESGRVLITKIDTNRTRVFVHSEKNRKYQITGTEEEEFAAAIFSGMDDILARRQQ